MSYRKRFSIAAFLLVALALLGGCASQKSLRQEVGGEYVMTILSRNNFFRGDIITTPEKDRGDAIQPARLTWTVPPDVMWEVDERLSKGYVVVVVFFKNGGPIDMGVFLSEKSSLFKGRILEIVETRFERQQ